MLHLELNKVVNEQGPSTAHTQESLRPGCNYQVRVRARNMAGFGDYSRAIVISTAPDVPFSPAMPRCVFRSLTSLSLEWAPPSHDGGLPVTSYLLEVAPCTPLVPFTYLVVSLPATTLVLLHMVVVCRMWWWWCAECLT